MARGKARMTSKARMASRKAAAAKHSARGPSGRGRKAPMVASRGRAGR